MKIILRSIHSVICLLTLLCYCCAPVYVPNARNTPLFDGQGEFQATATAGIGYNVQSAYALTNHVGVMGNFLFANNKPAKRFQYRTQAYGELGLGYYNHIGNRYFDFYLGYGAGKGKAIDSSYYVFTTDIIYSARASYSKTFLQGAFGTKHRNFEWSISQRISRVHFNEINVFYGDEPKGISDQGYFYLEPALNIKIALTKNKKAFFVIQSGMNIPLYNESTNDFNIERIHSVTGLQLRIGPTSSGN